MNKNICGLCEEIPHLEIKNNQHFYSHKCFNGYAKLHFENGKIYPVKADGVVVKRFTASQLLSLNPKPVSIIAKQQITETDNDNRIEDDYQFSKDCEKNENSNPNIKKKGIPGRKSDTWYVEMEENLIDKVHKYPSLWNFSLSITERSPNRKLAIWTEISDAMKVEYPDKTKILDIGLLSKKWENLRTSYNRKMALDSKKKQTGSAGGTPDKKWVHEDRMKFLSDIDTNEETDSNIAEQDINVKNKYKKRKNHQEQKVEALQHTLEQLISKCAPPPPPPPPPQISQQQHLQQPELKNPHVLGFLHFMGTIIDDLPPDLLQEAMLKIHVLLDEYRRKAVDQLQY